MDKLREKVIRGLEIHLKPNSRCVGCPYPNNGLCGDQLYRDALALLKEQEARLMTMEEVEKWIETPEERKDPIFVEYGKKMKYGRSGWRTGFFGFSPQHDTHSYGTVLRCWTSRPTYEQMEAVKWDADT